MAALDQGFPGMGQWDSEPCHLLPGAATCSASGDPHYLTFDGALHNFMGTCAYVLVRPCVASSRENNFLVTTTNEIRDGNLELSYIKSVNVQIFNLKISLIKGRRVVVSASSASQALPDPARSALLCAPCQHAPSPWGHQVAPSPLDSLPSP